MQGLCYGTVKDNCVFTENRVIVIVWYPGKLQDPSKTQNLFFFNLRLIIGCEVNP